MLKIDLSMNIHLLTRCPSSEICGVRQEFVRASLRVVRASLELGEQQRRE